MKPADRDRFMRCLLGCAELYGKEVGEGAGALWLDALQSIPIETIEMAFSAHIRDTSSGKFMPRPADIISQAEGSDGRPDADEAWSLVPHDEHGSTVWTQEIASAFGVCCDLIGDKDSSAARMAFRAAYQREVQEARQRGDPVHWFPSFGRDPSLRAAAVERAMEKGRISASYANALLPAPDHSPKILPAVAKTVKHLTGA